MALPSNFRANWRLWLLHFALIGWVTGFWWCRGRWEHGMWLQWIVLPVFALNADHIWALWKEWFGELGTGFRKNLWWLSLFSLIEWQFWIAGFRTGDWWGGAGSGKDLVLLVILISALVLLARSSQALTYLWRSVVCIAFIALMVSAIQFYSQYGVSEERFRLVWRYAPGFNAVTTGILVGFALVASIGSSFEGFRFSKWMQSIVLLFLGAVLAASESRGALLAVFVALFSFVVQPFLIAKSKREKVSLFSRGVVLLPVFFGYLSYWLLALRAGESSGGLVSRGSAGRLDVYQAYLADLSFLDWMFGKGHVPTLPPEELGWLVHHPHSAYLGQLVGYGLIGTLALLVILVSALWKIRARPELPLVFFGLAACLFDGGQIFSVLSLARWEILVVLIPLVIAITNAERTESADHESSARSAKPSP